MIEPTLEDVEKAELEGLRRHGWYVHIHQSPTNYHTHGLSTKYSKIQALDFQIVRDMNHVLANVIFWSLADKLAAGCSLKAGEKHDLKEFGMVVMLANAVEGFRVVHRIILPDLDGWLLPDQQAKEYAEQWKGAIIP